MSSLSSQVLVRSDRALRTRRLTLGVLLVAGLSMGGFLGARKVLGPTVPVVTVGRADFEERLVASGRVRTPSRSDLGVLIAGIARDVPHREGEHVKAGDLLLQLNDAQLRAQLAEAEAQASEARARLVQVSRVGARVAALSLRRADADLTRADQQLTRMQQLIKSGSIPQAELDDAVRAHDAAHSARDAAETESLSTGSGGAALLISRAAVLRAEAAVASAKARLEDARIVAPTAGTIVACDVDVGDVVTAGKVLISLVAEAPAELVLFPDEGNLRSLHLGQAARVSADAYPAEVFDAKVSYIAPAVDAARGTVEVRLSVARAPAYLKPEMTVSVDVALGVHKGALAVPVDAVRDAVGSRPSVLVVEDGRVKSRRVTLGLRSELLLEISQGLNAGERVLADASVGIEDGKPVRALESKAP